MRCFDCAATEITTDAVAVCGACGAGMCLDHVIVGHSEQARATIGNPTVTRLPGRRLFCRTCADAYVADSTVFATRAMTAAS